MGGGATKKSLKKFTYVVQFLTDMTPLDNLLGSDCYGNMEVAVCLQGTKHCFKSSYLYGSIFSVTDN